MTFSDPDNDLTNGFDDPICGDCGLPCTPIHFDDGIGEYEWWGYKCRDTRWCIASDCCNSAVIESSELEKEIEEANQDGAD